MAALSESCLPARLRRRTLRVLLAAPAGAEGAGVDRVLAVLPAVEVVARAETESRALQLYFRERPDVTVFDSRVALDEPARFIGLLRRVAPEACIVALVPAADSMPARAARALGADVVVTLAALADAIEVLACASGTSV